MTINNDDVAVRAVFSRNLRYLMEHQRMNQRELATRLGVGAATVNDWVKGRTTPRSNVLQQLMSVFHCDLSDLLSDAPAREFDKVSRPELPDTAYRVGFLYTKATPRDCSLVDTILAPYDDGQLLPAAAPVSEVISPAKSFVFRGDPMDEIDVFDQPAAAGFGNYLDAPVAQREQYPHGMIPKGTTFGILISGHSM